MARIPFAALVAVIIATLMSGAAGLAYEVVWSRMLVVPLGNSADATALVLASFMLGIALGARLLGGLADTMRFPLKLYATVEILLGAYALFMPLMVREISSVDFLLGDSQLHPFSSVALIFGTSCLLVVIPAMAMGATIPVLVRALSLISTDIRLRIGIVYGANTIGASIGAAVAGFWGIPILGLTQTSQLAALGSIGSGMIVLAVNRLVGMNVSISQKQEPPSAHNHPNRTVAMAALAAVGVSGFAVLSAEVLWTRVLTFIFGHDTYAFAVLLAVVLAGLGLGGLIHRKLANRDPLLVVAALTGLLAMALMDAFWVATALVAKLGRNPFGIETIGDLTHSIRLEFYRELAFTSVLVLIPTILAGAAFPAACSLYAGPLKHAGKHLGKATLVNGIGAVLGSLVTSFVLVAWLGIQGTLIAVCLLTALVAGFVLYAGKHTLSTRQGVILAIPLAATVLMAIAIPANLPQAMLMEAVGANHQRIVHYREGRTGTVSVTENTINNEKQLFMNAVNEVSTRLVHKQSFKLLGHLGPLLHQKPRHGLMICLGAGLSAGAALTHPYVHLDVVELSSAIPEAATLWKNENNNVLADPRFTLHIGDGRHFLLKTNKRYDVVTVDSTHPKAVDSWILYTREFYQTVRSRLDKGGILVQWVPLHGLSEREFKIIVRTFQSVFKETTMWANVGFETYGQATYVKLVGTDKPLQIDYRELKRRLGEPRIEADLAPFGMAQPEALLDAFLAGPEEVREWVGDLPVQTDDHPIVPFTTAFSAGRRMSAPMLLSVRSKIWPRLRNISPDAPDVKAKITTASEAHGFLLAGNLDRALEMWPESKKLALFKNQAARGQHYYLQLAKRYPTNPDKLFEIGSYLGNLGYVAEAVKMYQQALRFRPRDQKITLNLALVLMDQGHHRQAEELLDAIIKGNPKSALAHYNLGIVLADSGDKGGAIEHLKNAVALSPGLLPARLSLAEALLGMTRLNEAEKELKAVIEQNRWIAEAWNLAGLVAAAREDWEKARANHLRALHLEPYRAGFHYNLGIAQQKAGRLRAAALAYRTALLIEPNDAEAQNNLGLVYAAGGIYDMAVVAHSKALEIEPNYPEAAYNLGLAYKAQGQTLAAVKAFGLALKIAPDLAPAREQLEVLGIDEIEIELETDGESPQGVPHGL
jgi:spermidine synthase